MQVLTWINSNFFHMRAFSLFIKETLLLLDDGLSWVSPLALDSFSWQILPFTADKKMPEINLYVIYTIFINTIFYQKNNIHKVRNTSNLVVCEKEFQPYKIKTVQKRKQNEHHWSQEDHSTSPEDRRTNRRRASPYQYNVHDAAGNMREKRVEGIVTHIIVSCIK